VHGSFGYVTWISNGRVFLCHPPTSSFLTFALPLVQSEYRGILKSVGFQEAPTGELREREKKVLDRKKDAELIYDRLSRSVEASQGVDQRRSVPGSAEDADFLATVNDSTDAEGEPDTTTSAPPIAVEKANGENVQKIEGQGESNMKASPPPEVCRITLFWAITVLTRVSPVKGPR